MTRLADLLSVDSASLDETATNALVALRQRAKREASCRTCRGYGWHAKDGLPEPGEEHAAQVLVCDCAAGDRFWSLALADTALVLALMDLDVDGRIASLDGLYGRFGINDRRLLLTAARSPVPQ